MRMRAMRPLVQFCARLCVLSAWMRALGIRQRGAVAALVEARASRDGCRPCIHPDRCGEACVEVIGWRVLCGM